MKIGRKIVYCEGEKEFEKVVKLLDLEVVKRGVNIYTGKLRGDLIARKGSKFSKEIPEKAWNDKGWVTPAVWDTVEKGDKVIFRIRFAPFWLNKLRELIKQQKAW